MRCDSRISLSGEERAQQRRGSSCPAWPRACWMPGIERHGRTEERFERHGARNVRGAPEAARVAQRERRDRRVRLRAVDQRQALPWAQATTGASPPAHAACAVAPAVRPRRVQLALADQRQRQMGQRREITARADTALLRHQRVQLRVQHRDQEFGHFRPAPGESLREHVGAEQHHRAHFARRERWSHAGRMAADEIDLELGEAVVRNRDVGELAESGRHAVHDLTARDDRIDDRARPGHPGSCRGRQAHWGAIGDGGDISDRE